MSHRNLPAVPGSANLIGVILAFSLLGLAIYQNRVELAKVFAKPVDLRYFAVGLAIYLGRLLITFTRWYTLVRAQGLPFRSATRSGSASSATSSTW